MCNVSKVRICKRPHNPAEVPGAKKPILDHNPLFYKYDPDNTPLNGIKRSDKAFQNSRMYLDENGQQLHNEIQYEDLQHFSKIMRASCFGGRVLPPFELYMNTRKSYYGQDYVNRPKDCQKTEGETEEQYQLKSFLNVIADSGVVETYLITKIEMQYFHDQDLKLIYERLIQIKEPDRPCTEVQIQQKFREYEEWEKLKLKKVAEIRWLQKIAKQGVMSANVKDTA